MARHLSESAEQERLVNMLRARKIIFFSVPNERKSPQEWPKLRRMGARKGVSDLVILCGEGWPNICLEMKSRVGRLRPEQKEWMRVVNTCDGWAGVAAYGCEDAVEVLAGLGLDLRA